MIEKYTKSISQSIIQFPGELTRQRIAKWKPTDSVNPEELGELPEGDIAGGYNGIIDERYRWPNGVVPYVITPGDFSKLR